MRWRGLFVEGLRLCAAAGLADLSVVALDGTKMAADAALDRNRDGAWIRAEVAELLAATAAEEPAVERVVLAGVDATAAAELASPRGRLARLRAALALGIETEDAAAAAAAQLQAEAAHRDAAERGRELGGRKPQDPAAALARERADHQVALERAAAKQAERAAKVGGRRGRERQVGGFARAPSPRARARSRTRALAAAEQAAQNARTAVQPAWRQRDRSRQPDDAQAHGWGAGLQRPSDRQPAPDRAGL